MNYFAVAPKGLKSWLEALPLWLGKKLYVPDIIRKELGYDGDVLFTEHHEAHAASAYYPSPFAEAAFLTVDGVGEWATASYGSGKGEKLHILKELHYPDSLGLLYSAFTYFTGFRVNSGEYKLMGLAPYGSPIYKDVILSELVDVKDDGSIRLNLPYFQFLSGLRMTSNKMSKLFGGPPREMESEITKREMDLAASIQAVTEEVVMKMAHTVYKETGHKNLCLAGGVALNCVANGRLLREGPFDDIWIQPAAGDAGGALGAAFSVWHRFLEKERVHTKKDKQQGSYLGPAFSSQAVLEFLQSQQCTYHKLNPNERSSIIAGHIADGKIVGYMEGRMEFGPRALGARSILGNPCSPETQIVMNKKIKFRESFRPFAPSVLAEKVSEYFDIDRPSPYMMLVANVQEHRTFPQHSTDDIKLMERLRFKRSDIPAVTHLDYSARVQTVDKSINPRFHEIILEFERLTGCAVVVNTSFNVRGEPIVCTPEEAYQCFMRTEIDVLVIEDYILLKEEQTELEDKGDWYFEQYD